MGRMVDGEWRNDWYEPDAKGRFIRPATRFREHIRADGSTPYPPAAGRYHLYVSLACPWAHRALIVRALRGLEGAIGVSIVEPRMGDQGWPLDASAPDPIHPSARHLHDVYRAARPDYSGRVTVPVLWDRERATIVSNESRDIMRMLDTEMESFATRGPTLAPLELRSRIDETLDAIYGPINDGVYRAGFASSQEAYESAVRELFEALDRWDAVLQTQRHLCGAVMTEADVALFTTLVRFDLVYHGHFKCNVRRIADYPGLSGFVRDLYSRPEIRATTNLEHVKTHYYWSHPSINPSRIVPVGPTLTLDMPHDRARLSPSA